MEDIDLYIESYNKERNNISSTYGIFLKEYHNLYTEPTYLSKLASFKLEVIDSIYENKLKSSRLGYLIIDIKSKSMESVREITNWKEKDIVINNLTNNVNLYKEIVDNFILFLININKGIENLSYSMNKIM